MRVGSDGGDYCVSKEERERWGGGQGGRSYFQVELVESWNKFVVGYRKVGGWVSGRNCIFFGGVCSVYLRGRNKWDRNLVRLFFF